MRGTSFTSSITRNMAPVSDLPEPGVSTMEMVRVGAYLGEGDGVPGSGEGLEYMRGRGVLEYTWGRGMDGELLSAWVG